MMSSPSQDNETRGESDSNGDGQVTPSGLHAAEASIEEGKPNGGSAHSPNAMPERINDESTTSEEESEEEEGEWESDGVELAEDEIDDPEDDPEDDEEPALKYQRVGGSLDDLLKKDAASALSVSNKLLALGTHAGIVHILDLNGKRIKSYKPHLASVSDIDMDTTACFVATASMDGQIVMQSLFTNESYAFDMKRPMRTVAMEPHFAKRSSRALVCGGLAGTLVLHERGWMGHKATTLHVGEGPIWQIRWRGRLIAWANDLGVKIYDTLSQSRITVIDRPPNSPRADLFKCTLYWQDDSTLLISWADHINVARIRSRGTAAKDAPPLLAEITAVFQMECMIAGILPHPTPPSSSKPGSPHPSDAGNPPTAMVVAPPATSLPVTSLIVIAYTPPDTSFLHGNEMPDDPTQQKRKVAERPELRIISRAGEELTADALGVTNFQSWTCNDYVLAEVGDEESGGGRCYVVLSPKDIVVVRQRDSKDHVAWLVSKKRYEEALDAVEKLGQADVHAGTADEVVNATEIGQRYIKHLISEGDFAKAALLCPKVCGQDMKRWEDWIFFFAQQKQLKVVIPYVPTESPRLGHLVYEMILAYFLSHDQQALFQTIKQWPKEIYDISAVIVAIQAELDRATSTSTNAARPDTVILMECMADLYTANRQPGKALPFYLRLRRATVFDLIREHNLFTDVQDQALLLVEFDHELMEKRKAEGQVVDDRHSEAITLLVDHIHSIRIGRVVQQLQSRPYYLFLYLEALFEKDPHSASNFADIQVKLYAEYATLRLLDFLRASSNYNLEMAYSVCKERDLVPEMVFLLGRMGNNKQALTLIIERLGDVNRAIDFAKEQSDGDLWEDLLKYSETRPPFIRGLLENVGAEIDPVRLIRRIKNGLEIPGLKEALIKILQDFHLQISLLEGCHAILNADCSDLARKLQRDQTNGFFINVKTLCPVCGLQLQQNPQTLVLLFLCRHVVHASCVSGGDQLPIQPDVSLVGAGMSLSTSQSMNAKIALASTIRAKLTQGCPVCHKKAEGNRT